MGIVVVPTISVCKEYGTKENKIVAEKSVEFSRHFASRHFVLR